MGIRKKRNFRRKFKINNKKNKELLQSLSLILVLSFVVGGIYTVYENKNYEKKIAKIESLKIEEEKIKFIKDIEKEAESSYKEYGVLPSITISQAILESGWGQSELTKISNNLFGIKSDERWKGENVEVATSENYSDEVMAKFRKYNSLNDSIRDHAKFLKENPRYAEHGLFKGKDYKSQAQALEDAGYSTKKNEQGEAIYADMLIDLIERYNLNLID
ncbi:glycoside hydrolase family 73 protein [Paraclostridium bifermentans]|uniref:glycoside hydrolase family 73 protein n=1 Tax=Paraclostridium bifermentans TaxID=1490 RepID=UPI001C81BEF5|nr:glucosaminidase domain-containing protein [Paraclostridium bifermentans]GIM33163.1 hypothetical protein PAGU1678_24330 [Paraclostridium bifermentans subsp. muricolitidis]